MKAAYYTMIHVSSQVVTSSGHDDYYSRKGGSQLTYKSAFSLK